MGVNTGSSSSFGWHCCQKECSSHCTLKSLLNLLNVFYTCLLQLPLPENSSSSLPCSFCQKSSLNIYIYIYICKASKEKPSLRSFKQGQQKCGALVMEEFLLPQDFLMIQSMYCKLTIGYLVWLQLSSETHAGRILLRSKNSTGVKKHQMSLRIQRIFNYCNQ